MSPEQIRAVRQDFAGAKSVTLYGENIVWKRVGKPDRKGSTQFHMELGYDVLIEEGTGRILVTSEIEGEDEGEDGYSLTVPIDDLRQIEVKLDPDVRTTAAAWWTRQPDGSFVRTDHYPLPVSV